MGTTVQELSDFLTAAELKHKVKDDGETILTGYRTEWYQDSDGDKLLSMRIRLAEKGEYIFIEAPRAYTYKDGPHKAAVFQVLLHMSYRTKLIQWEYDPSDGEIRALIEFPLEDAKPTQKQIRRCLSGLVQLVDDYHDVIRTAMETGVVNMELEHNRAPKKGSEELSQMLDQLREAAGPELFAQIAAAMAGKASGTGDAPPAPALGGKELPE